VAPPTGTVTFLFTDIEGSTRLWDEHPGAMQPALARHDALLRSAVEAHGGYVFSWAGDGLGAAFQRAADAVAAAVDAQLALAAEPWPEGAGVRVRIGLHTGEAEERDGNYFGSPVNRAARVMAAANGGQVVVTDVTAGVIAAIPGIGLVDLGVHRLRGLTEPRRVFGVKADGLGWADLPLASADVTRGNLPRPATEWFGPLASVSRRASELGHRRLVTLTGPGGVGKTRLAIEVGGLVAGDFPDGVWMVELAPLSDPDAVLATVAATLGVLPQEGGSLVGAIVDWLEGRRLLLIVDNCEHVLGPVTELVGAIIEARPTVTVIATSREPLGVEGERVAPVPSLGELDAVELFCDRASAVDDTMEFSVADRATIGAICTRLDGIPLAIELAAARARSLTPADLLDRLADRFRVVRGGGRGVERHQTLRATVDWSYRLLPGPERLLFDRLSVFAGGFDLAAAEGVCAGDAVDERAVVDLLMSLVDKSLVDVDRTGRATRYRLLETLRQYGEERLDERGETDALRRRHLAHYITVAEAALSLWSSPRGAEGTAIFDREWDNFRSAVATALDLRDPQGAAALLGAIAQHAVFNVRSEYVDWVERAVASGEGTGDGAVLYGSAAAVAWESGEIDRAIALATRGTALGVHDFAPGAASCWAALGIAYLFSSRVEDARAVVGPLEAALDGADPLTVLQCSFALVTIAVVGDHPAAARHAERARTAAGQAGSPALQARAAWIEGLSTRLAQPPDPAGALACHRRGLALAREASARLEEAQNLLAIASINVQLRLETADAALAEGIAYAHDLRFWPTVWVLLRYAASHLVRTGRPYAAGVLAGHLEAHQPLVLGLLDSSAMSPFIIGFTELVGPETDPGRATGAAMDRNELVTFALSALSPEGQMRTDADRTKG
jgi:predicted ATPase/class 3 adenylate cyclase